MKLPFRLPLFIRKKKINGDDNGKAIAVGFFIHALTKPIAADNNSSRRSSVDLNAQFYTSGNTPAGMRQMQQLYVKTKTWKVVTLVSSPD